MYIHMGWVGAEPTYEQSSYIYNLNVLNDWPHARILVEEGFQQSEQVATTQCPKETLAHLPLDPKLSISPAPPPP